MSSYVLGIDGGGTSTRAVLVDLAGSILGVGRSGASNYNDVGVERAQHAIDQAVAAAASQAGVARSACAAVFLGMAGVTSDQDHKYIRQMATNLALAPAGRIGVDHDCRAALAGGLEGRPGIVQIVGTGSSCYGRNAAGVGWMVGGRGHLISDEGSSYWLGVQAMRAAVMAYDGRLPGTLIYHAVLAALGIASVEEILHRLYVQGMARAEIAALAPLVVDAARAGDATAQGLLDQGAADIAECIQAAAVKLGFAGQPFELCLVGGLLQAGPIVVDRLHAAIRARAPEAQIKPAALPPAFGAVILALQLANVEVDKPLLARLHSQKERV
jgi:N-acetylglucosamine kinase-like BadF-type ATPase